MSRIATTSNVYYLPARVPDEPVRRSERKTTWRARLTRTWWRLRFTIAEIWSISRRGGRHLSFGDDGPIFLGGNAGIFERPRPRRTEPARVLDFVSARLRLRPASV